MHITCYYRYLFFKKVPYFFFNNEYNHTNTGILSALISLHKTRDPMGQSTQIPLDAPDLIPLEFLLFGQITEKPSSRLLLNNKKLRSDSLSLF